MKLAENLPQPAAFETREQLDDIPGTKEYRDAANILARALEFRFKNCDPNRFVTSSGRVDMSGRRPEQNRKCWLPTRLRQS